MDGITGTSWRGSGAPTARSTKASSAARYWARARGSDGVGLPPMTQMIPLVHACVMGGRPTPSEPRARAQYLAALDTFVLRAVGAPDPRHEVPAIPPTRASDPVHGEREHDHESIAAAG